jgi:hypothetical protein
LPSGQTVRIQDTQSCVRWLHRGGTRLWYERELTNVLSSSHCVLSRCPDALNGLLFIFFHPRRDVLRFMPIGRGRDAIDVCDAFRSHPSARRRQGVVCIRDSRCYRRVRDSRLLGESLIMMSSDDRIHQLHHSCLELFSLDAQGDRPATVSAPCHPRPRTLPVAKAECLCDVALRSRT